ncbi:MAG TPA: hypothetical protein VKB79_20795 [Bryobacteraceae bacterium]|nr:hypothetical protein [Bryobacteraceae bacterium]
MTSRRRLVLLAAAAGSFCKEVSVLWGATPFWERKPSTQWTDEEIHQLTTRSPWARETNLDFEAAEGGHLEVPGSGSPYDGRGATTPRPAGVLKKAPVIVRWESAEPIRMAMVSTLPKGFEDRYAIGVSNIPPEAMNAGRRGQDGTPQTLETMLRDLEAAATLEAPGKEPAGAGIVRRIPGAESTYVFGFAKEFLQFTAQDREALFTLRTPHVSVKAKFNLKEMIYRGKLAL